MQAESSRYGAQGVKTEHKPIKHVKIMEHYTNNKMSFDALKRRANAICFGVDEINKAFEIAIPVIESMDGKVLNKRLSTAIQSSIDKQMGVNKVSVRLEYEYSGKATLVFGLYNRSYSNKPNSNGYSTCSYFDGEIYGHIYTDMLGTIDAEKVIPALRNAIAYNKRTAYKYTDAVKHFKRDIAKYEKALDSFKKVYSTINPLLCPSSLSSYDLTNGYSYPKLSAWEEEREKALNL